MDELARLVMASNPKANALRTNVQKKCIDQDITEWTENPGQTHTEPGRAIGANF